MPIPIDFEVRQQPPSDIPEDVQEFLNWIGDSLKTVFDSSFDPTNIIFGRMDGVLPNKDVGPWSNGTSWWFWDANQGAYVQGTDGVPIGTIMLWGGQSVPNNYLICDGSEISRITYQPLFQVIGTTWGPGDSATTFNLPPGGVAYINAPGFVPNASVILSPNIPPGMSAPVSRQPSAPSGLGCIGGSQLAPLLVAGNLPPLQVLVPYITVQLQQPGVYTVGYPAPSTDSSAGSDVYQILDQYGAPLNVLDVDQSQFPTMPPFASANHIIKYQ